MSNHTIKGFAYCCHFPKLSYPALHCVLMLKNKLIPFQRFKWNVHFYPIWLSRNGTAKKSTEELLNTLYLFLSLKKIYNFMLTNPRSFYPFKQPLSKHLDYRPLRVPPYIFIKITAFLHGHGLKQAKSLTIFSQWWKCLMPTGLDIEPLLSIKWKHWYILQYD